MILPLYAGEVTHHTRHGIYRWKPEGPLFISSRVTVSQQSQARDIEDYGEGGVEGARLFVGFNVGGRPTWTLQEVADATYEARKRQGASGDASFLLQRGIYEATAPGGGTERIDEDSAQVIILNTSGEPDFTRRMLQLGEELRVALRQERVIIELQKGGVVTHVYSATDPAVLQR